MFVISLFHKWWQWQCSNVITGTCFSWVCRWDGTAQVAIGVELFSGAAISPSITRVNFFADARITLTPMCDKIPGFGAMLIALQEPPLVRCSHLCYVLGGHRIKTVCQMRLLLSQFWALELSLSSCSHGTCLLFRCCPCHLCQTVGQRTEMLKNNRKEPILILSFLKVPVLRCWGLEECFTVRWHSAASLG